MALTAAVWLYPSCEAACTLMDWAPFLHHAHASYLLGFFWCKMVYTFLVNNIHSDSDHVGCHFRGLYLRLGFIENVSGFHKNKERVATCWRMPFWSKLLLGTSQALRDTALFIYFFIVLPVQRPINSKLCWPVKRSTLRLISSGFFFQVYKSAHWSHKLSIASWKLTPLLSKDFPIRSRLQIRAQYSSQRGVGTAYSTLKFL